MIYTIENGCLKVEISSLGAEIISLKKDGKERIWQNENGGWSGHAPILFPKCGDMPVIFNGVRSEMRGHGVARTNEFSLVENTAESITMSLESNAETKKVYPYDFQLLVTYRLDGAKLTVEYTLVNPSKTPLYAFFGSHESYALENEVDAYEIVFPETERFDSLIHNGDLHALTGEVKSFGEGKRLALPKDFMEDNTLIFANVKSRSVELRSLQGERIATLSFDGFEHLLFWHPAGSKMVCMEPWQNLPSFVDELDVEFTQRTGVRKLEGETKQTYTHTIEY